MNFVPVQIVKNGDMSANVNSIGNCVISKFSCSIQAVWSAGATGMLQIQFSNDNVPIGTGANPSANVVNWTADTVDQQSLTGSAGNYMWNVPNVAFYWIRLVYVRSSGSGTLNATLVAKGV